MGYASTSITGVEATESARHKLSPPVSPGGSRQVEIQRVSIKQLFPTPDKEQPETQVGYRVRLFDHPTRRTALVELEVYEGTQETIDSRPDALLPGQLLRAQTYTGYLYATAECVREVGEEVRKTIQIEVMAVPV